MKKYETKIIAAENTVGDLVAQLNAYGADGWRVVSFVAQEELPDKIILQRVIDEIRE